jgi:hypothetical protein
VQDLCDHYTSTVSQPDPLDTTVVSGPDR